MGGSSASRGLEAQGSQDMKSRLRDDVRDVEQHPEGSIQAAETSSCHSRGWFCAAAVALILVVAVILPLALTVMKQQQELAAATKPSIKSTATAKQGDAAAECMDLIHRGPSPLGNPPAPLKLQGSRIIVGKGAEVQFKGINWFGFNNNKTMVDGLDAGNSTWLAADFATVVYRLKLLGFNSVRLPFAFTDLDMPTKNYARACKPSAPRSADIAAATIIQDAARGRVPTPEEFLLPVASTSGTCNAYLPNGPTTLPRFLWVIQYLVANGMYVLIDYHPHLKELYNLADPDTFARKWHILWAAITCLPNYSTDLKGRIMLDLLNEPDEYGLGWAGGSRQGKRYQPLGAYLSAAMDIIEATTPGDPIFFIQGGGQVPLRTAWGDGFVTDPQVLRSMGLEDPSPFLKELLVKAYRRRVVLSPHFYGMTVTGNTATGYQLWEKFTSSWGRLQATGFCNAGDCQRFPVVIGEVGSMLRNPMDLQQLQDMATYLRDLAPTDQQQFAHARASGWFWFCYNANSKDTGGLVQDDWQSLHMHKLSWLFTNLELTPWWQLPQASARDEMIPEEDVKSVTLFST